MKKLAGKPFALIGVNSDRDRDKLKDVLKEENISWRSFWNGPDGTSGPISKAWNVTGWPTIYVLDGEGKIRYKNVRGADLDKALETLMAEAGHEVDLSNHDEDEDADDAEEEDSDEDESEEKKDAKSDGEDNASSEKKGDADGE